ncbi:MAG: hypothetical protein H7Y36_05705 [Armatimonadetes bacterium]|nr:hypothetical protein [Akkermansiaceae bacterium]
MNRLLPLVLITLLLVVFRIIGSAFPDSFPNFQPLAALFFCGACIAKDWRAWAIPLGAWLVTYPIPAMLQGNSSFLTPGIFISTAIAFAATFFIGKSLSHGKFGALLLGSLAAALAFHLITNGAAWIGSPLYPKNPTGLWQSLWTGPVGSPIPSWIFLRNMMAANLLFTAVFLSARFALPKFSIASAPAAAR